MTEAQFIWALAGAVLVGLAFYAWLFVATVGEAERKLGRELKTGEIILAIVATMVVPYGTVIAYAYVWWVMPERRGVDATSAVHPPTEMSVFPIPPPRG